MLTSLALPACLYRMKMRRKFTMLLKILVAFAQYSYAKVIETLIDQFHGVLYSRI
jgi:hypothetical protein